MFWCFVLLLVYFCELVVRLELRLWAVDLNAGADFGGLFLIDLVVCLSGVLLLLTLYRLWFVFICLFVYLLWFAVCFDWCLFAFGMLD